MIRTLLVLFFVCTYSSAYAQGGLLGVFSDAAGTDCQKADLAPGVFDVYVVHHATPGTSGSQFSIGTSGFTGLFLEFQTPYVFIGLPTSGITVCYGVCASGPFTVGMARYYGFGTSTPCSTIRVLPHPVFGTIESADCNENVLFAGGAELYVNPDNDCHCLVNTTAPSPRGAVEGAARSALCTVATRDGTWGKIKALYE